MTNNENDYRLEVIETAKKRNDLEGTYVNLILSEESSDRILSELRMLGFQPPERAAVKACIFQSILKSSIPSLAEISPGIVLLRKRDKFKFIYNEKFKLLGLQIENPALADLKKFIHAHVKDQDQRHSIPREINGKVIFKLPTRPLHQIKNTLNLSRYHNLPMVPTLVIDRLQCVPYSPKIEIMREAVIHKKKTEQLDRYSEVVFQRPRRSNVIPRSLHNLADLGRKALNEEILDEMKQMKDEGQEIPNSLLDHLKYMG